MVTWSSRERTCDAIERDWSAADADAYRAFADRWERAAERARPLMLEPPDRERWLEAVGEGILDGPIAAELAEIPSEPVRVPFAIQGLIGTLAGPDDPGTAFVGFYHDLGEAAGVPGAWGYARGGMGAVTAALRSAAEAAGARVRLESPVERVLVEDGRALGVVLADGDGGRRAGWCSRTPTRSRRPGSPGCRPPRDWRQAAPVVKVMLLLDGLPDFPSWPGQEPWQGAIDIGFTLDDLSSRGRRTRAPDAPLRGPGSRRRARRRPTTASRRRAATCCRCSASASRWTWTPTRRRTRRSRASPRCAPSCRTGSSIGWCWGRGSSRSASASRAATSSTARCCPASCFEDRHPPDRFGGIDGLYLAGSGAHPGGAVSGAPGISRGAGGACAIVARCFVTRELPGTALDRLRAEHDVDVWPGELPPVARGACPARARRRGSPVPPDRRRSTPT